MEHPLFNRPKGIFTGLSGKRHRVRRLNGRLYLRAELNVVFEHSASKIRTQLGTSELFLINASNADLNLVASLTCNHVT